MKKGFTVVEMAIVLVVIGLITGMLIKGRELIDTAKMRFAVGNINKIELAINAYVAANGDLPEETFFNTGTSAPYTQRYIIPRASFTEPGYIKESVFHYDQYVWQVIKCVDMPSSPYGRVWRQTDKYTSDGYSRVYESVCLYSNEYDATRPGTDYTGNGLTRMPARFICNIEVIMDDENMFGSNGRAVWTFEAESQITQEQFEDCKLIGESDLIRYMYKVF